MKVEVKQVEKKFEPIELVITIESEEELCNMWLRHNLNSGAVNKSHCKLKYEASSNDSYLFNELDRIVESLNLTR